MSNEPENVTPEKRVNLEDIAVRRTSIDAELKVARLSYTLAKGSQEGTDFNAERTETKKLDRAHGGLASYDIIGKIAEGTSLTRRTVTVMETL